MLYDMNRGINKPWEFRGLIGNNVYFLVVAIGLAFGTFLVLYFMSLPLVLTVVTTFAVGAGLLLGVYALNSKYGEHGLRKAAARRSSPKLITNRHSRLFINLNQDRTGH